MMLLTIQDKDVGQEMKQVKAWTHVTKVRAVILRGGRIAVLYLKNKKFYMLPGGTLEFGETKEEALHRELKEELGSEAHIIAELGSTQEYRSHTCKHNTDYGYLCKETSSGGNISLTPSEIEDGIEIEWLTIDEALKRFHSVTNVAYAALFHAKRDLAFLKAAKKHLEK